MNTPNAVIPSSGSGPSVAANSLGWVLLPLVCHFGFSWIGFNPTDEGWLQAIARRMLDGEIPHRDFISIRPVLSALLQTPVVWFGGEYQFWLARLWGWLEIGGIAWLWSGFLIGRGGAPWSRQLGYAAAFFLCAHVFPIMAWHTLDGLLLCSLGVAFARRDTPGGWRAAFICVGLAALCRQNFVFFTPFLLLGLPWRKWPLALWAGLPVALYAGVLAGLGALPDFIHQILASNGRGALRQTALTKYVEIPWFATGAVAGALLAWSLSRAAEPARRLTGLLVWGGAGVGAAVCLVQGSTPVLQASFALLGLATGLLLAALALRRLTPDTRFGLATALGLAWTSAISLGYNNPALMGGVLLLGIGRILAEFGPPAWWHGATARNLLAGLALLLGAAYWHARQAYPYQEMPAAELSWNAGEVMRGAAGLRTNARTYAVLLDLRELTDRFETEGRTYAILSDFSAHWAGSRQRNPLPCEWPQNTELTRDPVLVGRFCQDLCRLTPGGVVIVQKHLIAIIAAGFYPVHFAGSFYPAHKWLQQYGQRIGETSYFELYAPPALPVLSDSAR